MLRRDLIIWESLYLPVDGAWVLDAVLRRQVDCEGDVRMHLAVATSEASHGWIINPFPEFAATTAPKPWMRKFSSESTAMKCIWLNASNVFDAAFAGIPCTVCLRNSDWPFVFDESATKTFIPKRKWSMVGSMTRVCMWRSFLWMHSNLFIPPQSSSSTQRTLISFLTVGANTAAWMSKCISRTVSRHNLRRTMVPGNSVGHTHQEGWREPIS